MASKLPLGKRNAVLGRLWPKLKTQEFGGGHHLKTGFPPKPSASGFGGRRTSDRERELCHWRRSEGFVVRLDDGQHRVCLVCGNAAAPPSACLRGAAPHPVLRKIGRGNSMKKDIKFSTRMASEDREAIKELAKQSGMSMSDYVTACCLGKQVVVIDGLKEVLKELKSIGRNLNQLVTLAHMGRVTVIDLESVRQVFSELCGAVRLILERKRW